uniref:Uncharacterized protein n=1 Tax=Solibacter usitatus (strain Ellin6076) TaxID=234267 RepID=Q02AX9_SOLUE
MHNSSRLATVLQASVGIFWALPGKRQTVNLLAHRCSLTNAEPYGEMLICRHSHYRVWERWRRNPRPAQPNLASLIVASEYEEWPRGRIVYHAPDKRFILYADAQILRRSDILATIREIFGLPADQTDTKPDSHYVSTGHL